MILERYLPIFKSTFAIPCLVLVTFLAYNFLLISLVMMLILVFLLQVGIEAWKNAKDNTGLTPNDYACLRGYYSYIHLVQKKISGRSESGHVAVDIPGTILDCNSKQKQLDGHRLSKVASLETERFDMKATIKEKCRVCERKLVYGSRRSLVYRPAMLSMVAIAALCVCVALLFKSSPEVVYVFQPFRWERLKYGSS